MPSWAGGGLWLPDVGGLVLYVTLLVVCVRPSDGKVFATQPAALAAAASLSALASGPADGMATFAPLVDDGSLLELPPPPEPMSTAATATTAMTSTAPPIICSRRARAAAACAWASAASRSARRRSFSSRRLPLRPGD